MKAKIFSQVTTFQDIPNVGSAMEKDFALINIKKPTDLTQKDPFTLYKKLCTATKVRQDPCVLDTFLAVVNFMNGAPARPWWFYTKKRKEKYPII